MLIILLNTRRTQHNVAEPEGLLRVPQAAAIRPMSDHAAQRGQARRLTKGAAGCRHTAHV